MLGGPPDAARGLTRRPRPDVLPEVLTHCPRSDLPPKVSTCRPRPDRSPEAPPKVPTCHPRSEAPSEAPTRHPRPDTPSEAEGRAVRKEECLKARGGEGRDSPPKRNTHPQSARAPAWAPRPPPGRFRGARTTLRAALRPDRAPASPRQWAPGHPGGLALPAVGTGTESRRAPGAGPRRGERGQDGLPAGTVPEARGSRGRQAERSRYPPRKPLLGATTTTTSASRRPAPRSSRPPRRPPQPPSRLEGRCTFK